METTADIKLGQIVKSKAGRDKDKIFTVIDIIDEHYVLIVDGKYRKLDNPKKKKIKHLMVYKNALGDLKEKIARNQINNSYIRKELDPFNK